MLDFLIFRNAKGVKHVNQTLGAEKTHQIVLERNIKPGFARVSLTAGTASELIVNPS